MTKRKSLANPSKYPENFQGKCKRKSEKTKKGGQKSLRISKISSETPSEEQEEERKSFYMKSPKALHSRTSPAKKAKSQKPISDSAQKSTEKRKTQTRV
jgi:hypothetical protein